MSVLSPNVTIPILKSEPCASKFKFSELMMLDSPAVAYQLPMAVIGLVDMNAFFAQCEQVRLGRTLDDPVVCCQWSSLIAVSYAARKYGIGRMDTLQSAKDKCPGLVVGHAAVFQKGEAHWQYLDEPPNQAIHKVSLDPYRRELRKVFKILSRECDLVEKASIDECYMDLGRLVFAKLIELFPMLLELKKEDSLPPVPLCLPEDLRWEGKISPTDEEKFSQTNDVLQLNFSKFLEKKSVTINDWDDICFLIGSQILYKIRQEVFKELNYTTSGGLATTKTVAKLAGGFIKPDFQTIIRPKAIGSFLHNFELSDITQMGGQLGDRLLNKLIPRNGKHSITFIRNNWTLDQLRDELSDEPAVADRVFELCRGEFCQEIKQRTIVKSMMSRKNFLEREPVNTIKDCYDWIRVFVGDLYGRLIELDDENLNLSLLQKIGSEKERIYRPRTVSVQLITSSWSKMSRQTQFPVIKDLDKFRTSLELTAFRLLCELMDNSKLADDEIKYRSLKTSDEHLDQIGTPVLANMGVVITNFVTTSDANLIDSYGSAMKSNKPDNEEIKRIFAEINEVRQDIIPEPQRPIKSTRSNSYVKKMFEDFQNEMAANDSNNTDNSLRPKSCFKEDKNYVKKMFEDFQTSVMVERAASAEAPKKPRLSVSPQKQKETEKIKRKPRELNSKNTENKSTRCSKDDFLEEMIKTGRCNTCDLFVEDVFEHRDYHLALELSLKLNGDSIVIDSHKRRPLAQSQLPFAGAKRL
ncbi:DNA/RNA polymerase [Metschnikowia bicuspidata var. bicuspidata NRRL YB-4993]|uniref:DNA/RNA polymerase n=1 Tax=Metschnikowia bicuspidata var. bicuspidata NRRL YB-4993 TaxID=869754 RepID=A0A1A0HIL2_9ASCO|nr:DNA/RNA polymerase [Metschnikowia bicuspidata var. bicuspidata NRRL YB-4993]OBA23678.1 DNA/RNA polymerase [Metschnikowia bicuspidata var. bicuspidata NRRL YB-4993]